MNRSTYSLAALFAHQLRLLALLAGALALPTSAKAQLSMELHTGYGQGFHTDAPYGGQVGGRLGYTFSSDVYLGLAVEHTIAGGLFADSSHWKSNGLLAELGTEWRRGQLSLRPSLQLGWTEIHKEPSNPQYGVFARSIPAYDGLMVSPGAAFYCDLGDDPRPAWALGVDLRLHLLWLLPKPMFDVHTDGVSLSFAVRYTPWGTRTQERETGG